jgi:hypothetical protein
MSFEMAKQKRKIEERYRERGESEKRKNDMKGKRIEKKKEWRVKKSKKKEK